MAPDTPTGGPAARTDRNRSLERGIEILRAFRPGAGLLGNGEIAERTGLSRATVSRLCQTLVDSGFLAHERSSRAYRLAPPVLSLGHAMRAASAELAVAAPLMRAVAEQHKINVGLAAPDREEMVYLESVRYARRVSQRSVASGQRVPMELTSLGRAWMAVAPDGERKRLLGLFRKRRGAALAEEIRLAIEQVQQRGWCAAAWQAEVVAVAAPLRAAGTPLVLNLSTSSSEPVDLVARELAPVLLALGGRITQALQRQGRA